MKKMIAIGVAVACLMPASALAARPAKNSSFASCTSKNVCPLSFDTKKRKKIVNVRLYTKCATVPPMEKGYKPMKVNRKGKFRARGQYENVLGEIISYVIKGKFKSKKKAVGIYKVTGEECSDGKTKFVAKRRGPAS